MSHSAAQTFSAFVQARRSVRRYDTRPVARDVLMRLFEAARYAPSAHNRQPWRFVVIQDLADKACLADAMGARLAADRTADGDTSDAIAADVARSRDRLTQAPVLVLACVTLTEMDAYGDAARKQAERVMAIQSAAMAVQNLLLAAHAEGLGACWMCAPLFCPDVVRGALALPGDAEPTALVTLGYPAAPGRARERKTVSEIVTWRPTSSS